MTWFEIFVPAIALLAAFVALLWARWAGKRFDRGSADDRPRDKLNRTQ